MRASGLLIIAVLGAAIPSLAHAEKAKASQTAKIYSRPGEQATVVVTVKTGQAMTVLAKQGRWLKVRVSGRTGYVPRTKVEIEDNDEARTKRRRPFVDGRGTKRGFGGEAGPEDRIGADAVGEGADESDDDEADEADDTPAPKSKRGSVRTDDEDADDEEPPSKGKPKLKPAPVEDDEDPTAAEDDDSDDEQADDDEPEDTRKRTRVKVRTAVLSSPKTGSEVAFSAKPSDVLFVESTKGKWTEVSVEDGDIGWVLTSKLNASASDDDDEGTAPSGRRPTINARARVGMTLFRQALQTAGGTGAFPDTYTLTTPSYGVSLGGTYLRPMGKKLLIGGELTYDFAKGTINFDADGNGTMPSKANGFMNHMINLRALLGYDLGKANGFTVFGRLGYHFGSFQVANVQNLEVNVAKLPSEILKAPTLGVGLAIPRLTRKIGLQVTLDTMLVAASLSQTKNLEDGASPSAKGATLGAGLTYQLAAQLHVIGAYELHYRSYAFGAPVMTSLRGHMGTSVSRSDVNHSFVVGAAKGF
ncbi:MAG: SH3 domain-containing protein [Kofleriaceae bacterium]